MDETIPQPRSLLGSQRHVKRTSRCVRVGQRMSPARHRSFFFLPCQQGTTPHATGQLNSEARTHIWRQSVLKAACRSRGELRFIASSYSADTNPATPVAAETNKLADGPDNDQEEEPLAPPSQVTDVPTDIGPNPGPAGSIDSLSSLALRDFTQSEKFLLHYGMSVLLAFSAPS